MRGLASTYWDKFLVKDKKGKLIRNGILFEDLIEELLRLVYPAKWERTKKSHDFNRDFHITTQDKKIWAECKNYSNDISLDTIAPTLVMAQIFTVNTIVFFSYSNINPLARRKIYAFASRTKKDIHIVDEFLLDLLIIKQNNRLSKKFRPAKADIINTSGKKECCVDFYFVQNPIIGATLEERQIMPLSAVEKINYNSIFEVLVYCEPNSFDGKFRLLISTDEADREFNQNFQLIDNDCNNLEQLNITINFILSSGCTHRILFKPRFYKSPLQLPILKAEVYDDQRLVMTKKSPYRSVRNEWIGQTILVGQQYRDVVLNMEKRVLHNSCIGCFTIFGSSGTGKTRILNESLEILLYQIANAMASLGIYFCCFFFQLQISFFFSKKIVAVVTNILYC